MTEPSEAPGNGSAIDDVRRIREQFARDSGGDMRRHVEQTRAAFEEMQATLRLRVVAPSAAVSTNR